MIGALRQQALERLSRIRTQGGRYPNAIPRIGCNMDLCATSLVLQATLIIPRSGDERQGTDLGSSSDHFPKEYAVPCHPHHSNDLPHVNIF
jgi:hypothetical protein